MILIADTKHADRTTPPSWLAGAPGLQRRDGVDGRWWGIGDGYLVGPQDRPFLQLDDGWRVTLLDGFDPRTIARAQHWCPTRPVADLQGRVWFAPELLNQHGERIFRVSYGEDFLPALTPEQKRAQEIADAARQALITAAKEAANDDQRTGSGLPVSVAGRWAAELLALVNHVSVPVLGKLGLLDDALIGGVLLLATGLSPRMEASDG